MDCSLPMGFSRKPHLSMGFPRQRILNTISYSRGTSRPRDWTWASCVSCTGKRILYHCATWEALKGCCTQSLNHVQLCNPMDCSPPGPPVHRFSRQEYWRGLPYPPSRGSFPPRDRTQVSRFAGRFFTVWTTREAHVIQNQWHPKREAKRSG